mmetsp:Transcript_69362/g.104610  ORF Transcript_69362/g.104610 Transcript_69362/m.104610 type:complete len:534 (+) Transcript_69362:54-1655(+)
MMRNNNGNNDDDWSTVGAESVTTVGSSFVNVPEPTTHQPALTMEATAQNAAVGFFSNQKTAKICVTIKAMIDELADTSRAPVDLMAVLDKSGSMAGDKLSDCKSTMEHVCKYLTSKDRLGLVSFSYNAVLEIPACFMTPENKEMLKLKTKAIQAGGGTNLSGGLSLAAMEMAQTEKPNQIRSIFLLTDGYANSGIRNTGDLVTMVRNFNLDDLPAINEMAIEEGYGAAAEEEAASGQQVPPRIVVRNTKPVSLFCFGYGGSHNSEMLRSISDATPGGAYYFVERDSDVSTAFGDAMGGLLSVVGQSAYVHISVPPEAKLQGVKILKVHHKEAIKRSDTAYTVNVGDFYAEESRDVLFEVQLSTSAPTAEPVPHVRMTLNYMDTVNKKAAAFGPVECRIQRPPNDEVAAPNEHVEVQWLRIQTAQAIEDADAQARGSNLSGARSRLQSAMSLITASPVYSADSPIIFAMQTDVQDVLNGFRSAEQYRSVGTHCAANKGAYMSKQRCMESRASTYNVFRSSKKAKMSMDFQQTKK